MSAMVQPFFDILTALLTPLIAWMVYRLSRRQHETERTRFRFEAYDKRFRIYKVVEDYLRDYLQDGEASYPMLQKLAEAKNESYFLFGSDIPQYMTELWENGLKSVRTERALTDKRSSDEDVKEYAKRTGDLLRYFEQQSKQVARDKFKPYLWLVDAEAGGN